MLADVMKDKEEFWITKVPFPHLCSISICICICVVFVSVPYLYLCYICICICAVFPSQAEYEEKGLACLDKLGGSKE